MRKKSLDPGSLHLKSKELPYLQTMTANTVLNGIIGYDPDAELLKESKSQDRHPNSLDLEDAVAREDVTVDAQLMECDSMGRYRLVSYDKHSLYNRLNSAPVIEACPSRPLELHEAVRMKLQKLREAGGDLGRLGEPFANFTPLFMGPYYRQQYLFKMLEAKSKIYDAWLHNPVAHRIPLIITQFTLGKGVTFTCQDDLTTKVWQEFAKVNKLGTSMNAGLTRAGSKLRTWSTELSVDGEKMIQFIPKKDMLYMRGLDSATILDIVTDPEDIEKVYYYHQQFTTKFQQYVTGSIPTMRYIIRQIPGNDVLHIKINTFENEVRGRSDLYSVIGWIKYLKDLVSANVIKAYFQACYTWDVSVDGDSRTIKNMVERYKNYVPTPGSQYFHNKRVERTAMPPVNSAGTGANNDLLGLMNLIALGAGINPAYIVGSMSMNRAGVLTESEPATKAFFERQGIWDEALHSMFDRLSRWYYDTHGKMLSDDIEFTFPPINAVEKQAHLSALQLMRENKWFKDKRCAELAAKEWNVTSYDYEKEHADIVQEQKRSVSEELELNRIKSQAQSNLSLWQRLLANQSAKKEMEMIGPRDTAEQQGEGGIPSANSQRPQQPQQAPQRPQRSGAGGRTPVAHQANSGGLDDAERERTRRSVLSSQGKDGHGIRAKD